MWVYIIRRLLLMIPVIVLVSMIAFSIILLLPGDPALAILGPERARDTTAYQALRQELGLDRPVWVQYLSWVSKMAVGDFGHSAHYQQPVTFLVGQSIRPTVQLALTAMLIALLIALPIGIIAAVRHDTVADLIARSAAIIGLSVPGFWLATLIIVMPAIWWNWRPSGDFTPFTTDPVANLGHMLLPSVVLGVAAAAALMRLTRGMLLEVLRQDYVRTAWAKGLGERGVVLKHALRNGIIPVVTLLGTQLPQIIGGTVVIETIFGLPGMSRFLFDAINQRDYPVIQGVNLVVVSTVVLINLGVDALYAVLDPRIRY